MATSVQVLENCRVSPPAPPPTDAAAVDLSLPLTIFDAPWLNFHPMPRLLFYGFPHSKAHFIETIIPKFKESLSLSLKHFLPLAGNLVYPLQSGKPELRYVAGDSIPVTFAESSDDFNYLVGDQERETERFYSLVPHLPPPKVESGAQTTPVFALQVTVFPDFGLCIGITEHHVIGDANTIIGFLRAWASISKFNGDAKWLASSSAPVFDRSVLLKDTSVLDTLISKQPRSINFDINLHPPVTGKVRATFTICRADIQKLQNFVMLKRPNFFDASSFVVTCAYVWTCLLKATDAVDEEKVGENEAEYFVFSADCRERLDPSIPATYFGNYVMPCIATAIHGKLVGSEGLPFAAELVGDAVNKRVEEKEEILRGSWISGLEGINWKRTFGVGGLLNADIYDSDFGFGKPERFENIAIDNNGAMSLEKSWKFEGGLEVGLSMPKQKMDAFATIFTDRLKVL